MINNDNSAMHRNHKDDDSESEAIWHNAHIELCKHPTGRNQSVARHTLASGETVLSDASLASVLLPEQKGSRCDCCFRRSAALKRCSGCAEYWYCGMDCQGRQWKAIHKHICKRIAKFRTTSDFQTSTIQRQTDAFLLSHLLAEHSATEELPLESLSDPLATFVSLLPLSVDSQEEPPTICPMNHLDRVSPAVVRALWNRFSNNNFVIHSHLNAVGHGVFPLASRLFNHSCIPNAIFSYAFGPQGIRLQVKTLTEIKTGDEITIPYFDPALPFRGRQEICRYSYGFECSCPACTFSRSLGAVPGPPSESERRTAIENALTKYAFPDLELKWASRSLLLSLPPELISIIHEDFLPSLSQIFSDTAQDGQYSIALRSGLVLLALYVVIYPPRYPQTGLHCLEVAKTAWNASIREPVGKAERLSTARQFLTLASDSLAVLGEEGDTEDSPLVECATLGDLLDSN